MEVATLKKWIYVKGVIRLNEPEGNPGRDPRFGISLICTSAARLSFFSATAEVKRVVQQLAALRGGFIVSHINPVAFPSSFT